MLFIKKSSRSYVYWSGAAAPNRVAMCLPRLVTNVPAAWAATGAACCRMLFICGLTFCTVWSENGTVQLFQCSVALFIVIKLNVEIKFPCNNSKID